MFSYKSNHSRLLYMISIKQYIGESMSLLIEHHKLFIFACKYVFRMIASYILLPVLSVLTFMSLLTIGAYNKMHNLGTK